MPHTSNRQLSNSFFVPHCLWQTTVHIGHYRPCKPSRRPTNPFITTHRFGGKRRLTACNFVQNGYFAAFVALAILVEIGLFPICRCRRTRLGRSHFVPRYVANNRPYWFKSLWPRSSSTSSSSRHFIVAVQVYTGQVPIIWGNLLRPNWLNIRGSALSTLSNLDCCNNCPF